MSIEAIKQALEALERAAELLTRVGLFFKGIDKAITSLHQAIKDLEKQEPVAWLYDWTTSEGEFIQDWTTSEAETLRDTEPTIISNVRPLYLHPEKRQWVVLTQEDIDIAFDDTQEGGGFNEFAHAIEQRLKEKNT